jgi:hypothetical protein
MAAQDAAATDLQHRRTEEGQRVKDRYGEPERGE